MSFPLIRITVLNGIGAINGAALCMYLTALCIASRDIKGIEAIYSGRARTSIRDINACISIQYCPR